MKIKPVEYGTTSYHKEPVFRIFNTTIKQYERTLTEEDLDTHQFLCTKNSNSFVSSVFLDDPANNRTEDYWVDDIKSRMAFRVSELDSLYLIEK